MITLKTLSPREGSSSAEMWRTNNVKIYSLFDPLIAGTLNVRYFSGGYFLIDFLHSLSVTVYSDDLFEDVSQLQRKLPVASADVQNTATSRFDSV